MFIKAVGHFIWPTSTTSYSINPYSIHPCCWARSGCASSWESGWREDQGTESASTATRVSQSWERKVRFAKLQLALFAYCLYSEIQPQNSLGCRQTWWKFAIRHQNALLTWSRLIVVPQKSDRLLIPLTHFGPNWHHWIVYYSWKLIFPSHQSWNFIIIIFDTMICF